MTLSRLQLEQIYFAIKSALTILYSHDAYLIENKVNERTIVNRFSIYFQKELNERGFSEFNMDVEYNRDHSDIKRTVNFPRGTYPDVIVHRRGSNELNLCIIEFKTWWRGNIERDISKLIDYTSQDGKYKYGLGFSITLNRDIPFIQTVVNGHILNAAQRSGVLV